MGNSNDGTRNQYPDFEAVQPGLLETVRGMVAVLSDQLGLKIPDRVLVAPWIGRIRDPDGKIRSASTSQGWVRNESRFWSEWERQFPLDATLLERNRDGSRIVSKRLAQHYGWPTSGPNNVVGQKLVHHHINNGPIVVAIPEKMHQKLSIKIHAKPTVIGAVLRQGLRGAQQVGEGLVIDLVVDLLAMKFQQWRNDVALKARLTELQPTIDSKKNSVLDEFIDDGEFPESSDYYYNILLRITSKTTTAIGGGHAVVIPGTPRPELVRVSVSKENANRLIDENEAARVFGLSDGLPGGGLYTLTGTQLVVYSEPIP